MCLMQKLSGHVRQVGLTLLRPTVSWICNYQLMDWAEGHKDIHTNMNNVQWWHVWNAHRSITLKLAHEWQSNVVRYRYRLRLFLRLEVYPRTDVNGDYVACYMAFKTSLSKLAICPIAFQIQLNAKSHGPETWSLKWSERQTKLFIFPNVPVVSGRTITTTMTLRPWVWHMTMTYDYDSDYDYGSDYEYDSVWLVTHDV